MKVLKWWIFLLLLVLPFLVIIVVNETAPDATHEYAEDICTRYCHDKGCLHWQLNVNSSFQLLVRKVYVSNIALLKNNLLGWSYTVCNLVVYVFFFPGLALLLLYGLIRRRNA